MGRFLILLVVLMIIGGLILHYGVDIPWVTNWFGKLPGDVVVKRGKVLIYFPIVSCFIISVVISLIFSVVFNKSKTNKV